MCLLEDLPATQAVAYKSERKRKVSIKTVTFLQRLRWQKRWNNFAIRYIKIETKRAAVNVRENDSAKAA